MKDEHSGQEVEVAYKSSDSLTLNLVYFKSVCRRMRVIIRRTGLQVDRRWCEIHHRAWPLTSIGYKNFDYR